MTRTMFPTVAAALLLLPNLASAESACNFGVEPKTSGFLLNPIVDKLTITRAKPSAPGKTCSMVVGDEILELNNHVIPGARGLKVKGYFDGVKDGETYTLKVKRGNSVVVFSTK